MKYQMHQLTPDVLVEIFGDSKDWMSVLKNGKRVGTFSELRKRVLDAQARKDKDESRKVLAAIMKNDNIAEAKKYFESNIKNAEVFINQTQPNVHLNGSKCYIICGSTEKVRLGIMHAEMTFDEMQNATGLEGKPNSSKRHILFDNLTHEEARDIILTLCGN